ncbi:helix-hairpin-helix domain-containing protein [Halorubrum rutilum]|uniref:Helix-hairpin-helix domain-containing protein n=1 Tax=Halorubrum rutilum TaxID=1364933 RepID=A0ABD6AG96_9EURY|nr:helix-hairpin-helix domain-containing protein [Halorubrum rutilum]
MPRDELDATTDVVTLAEHTNGVGTNVASRLEDAGIETVADILITEEGALTEVPYVSDLRAHRIREAAKDIVGVLPRDVDFAETESVVSEAAIPLSVRRGEAVLTASGQSGTNGTYHTTDCSVVRGAGTLRERDWTWVENRAVEECRACRNPNVHSEGADASQDSELEPLVDSREVALEATVGEKLTLTMTERDGYANPWAVIDTAEPTEWETPTGDTWRTRRLRISKKMNGEEHYSECDLVVAADEIRLEDPPVKRRSAQPDAPSWRVESVGAVGRVSPSTYAQLQGRLEQQEARPEGDDSWKQYQKRGEA